MRALPHAVIGACAGVVLAEIQRTSGADLDIHTLGQSIHLSTTITLAAAAAFGALLPDLDHPRSLASNLPLLGDFHAPVRGVVYLLNRIRPVRNPFYPWTADGEREPHILSHRGPFHAPLLTPFVCWFIGLFPHMVAWLLTTFTLLLASFAGAGHPEVQAIATLIAETIAQVEAVSIPSPIVLTAIGLGFVTHLLADEPTKLGVPLLWPFVTETIRLPNWLCWRSGSAPVEWLIAGAAVVAAVTYGQVPMFHG